jgi:hypothetical protein
MLPRWRTIAGGGPRRTALLVILLGVLGGCGGKPMPFPIPESELGDRPGLFTGEKGSWEVFSRDLSPEHPGDRNVQQAPR